MRHNTLFPASRCQVVFLYASTCSLLQASRDDISPACNLPPSFPLSYSMSKSKSSRKGLHIPPSIQRLHSFYAMASHHRSISSSSSTQSSSSIRSTSSASSIDEDELNSRVRPVWERHRKVLERRGVRLDTARDVRRYYESILRDGQALSICEREAYSEACRANDDALNGDAGLVCVASMWCAEMPSMKR